MASKISNNALIKNNSETIGFVVSCLFSSAISISEFNDWVTDLIEKNDIVELPDYIFDLIDYNDSIAKIFKVIGFTPSWGATQEERNAIDGIRVMRGIEVYEKVITNEKALKNLSDNQHILESYKYIFPFINIDH